MEINKIYQGNSLEVLKTFPDNSINMCMTSPPYWALRAYGTQAQIWDGQNDCQHEWGDDIQGAGKNNDKSAGKIQMGNVGSVGRDNRPTSNICIKCGAWRGELGLEPTFQLYIKHLCDIFDEVKRVLKKEGTCFINLGDSYNSHSTGNGNVGGIERKYKPMCDIQAGNNRKIDIPDKCLCQIPSRFSIEMVNRGWVLRNQIVWFKRNCMPSSVTDRFTVDYELLFFFVKSKKYYFEQQIEKNMDTYGRWGKYTNPKMKECKNGAMSGAKERTKEEQEYLSTQGRNKRCVWDITTKPYKEAHFATYPEELCVTPIKAGCPENGIVLDPFCGAGTTCMVAKKLGRKYIGIEINPQYIELAEKRIENECGGLL